MEKKENIVPKGFFLKPRKIITSEEALKDVIPVDLEKVFKDRKDNDNQIIKLVKNKYID